MCSTQGIQMNLLSIKNAINTSVGGNTTRKVLFELVSGEVMIQNQCNLNVRVIHYDDIARKNLDSHSSAGWGSWAPNIAWSTGEQDEGVAATN